MKKWIVILSLALLLSNGFWINKTLNYEIALSYAAGTINSNLNEIQQAMQLVNLDVLGRHADELLVQLDSEKITSMPFEKEGCINVGFFCLELNESRHVTAVSCSNCGR